jgi:hypothetical protein
MFTKFARGASLLALAVAAVGCSDSPTEPQAFEEWPVDPAVSAVALSRGAEYAEPITVSQVIGREGGTIEMPQTGLTLVVPRGAVDHDLTFTITTVPGDMLAYDFGPHGTQFNKPLRIIQRLELTGWAAVGRPGRIEAGYFPSPSDVDAESGEVRVESFLPVVVDPQMETASFRVKHFSGYMLSTGRRNSTGSAENNVEGTDL